MSNYIKENILNFALQVKEQGIPVYLAESKTYGYFHDAIHVVSFSFGLSGMIQLHGHWKATNPKEDGSGWRIGEHSGKVTKYKINSWLNSPPQYNRGSVRLLKPEEYALNYSSSKWEAL